MATIQKFLFERTFDGSAALAQSAPQQPRPVDIVEAELARDEPAEETEEQAVEQSDEEQPGYSEEQLEAAKKESHEVGKQEGLEEARKSIEQETLNALRSIAQHMTDLFGKQEHSNNTLIKDGIGVSASIVRKMFPAMDEQYGSEEVCRLVEQTLLRLIEEPRVVIRINPVLSETLGSRLDGLKAGAGYEGRFVLKEDPNMSAGDCRLEWGDGSAERNVEALWNAIDEIVEANIGPVVRSETAAVDLSIEASTESRSTEPQPAPSDSRGEQEGKSRESPADLQQDSVRENVEQANDETQEPPNSGDSEASVSEAVRQGQDSDMVSSNTDNSSSVAKPEADKPDSNGSGEESDAVDEKKE